MNLFELFFEEEVSDSLQPFLKEILRLYMHGSDCLPMVLEALPTSFSFEAGNSEEQD